MNLIRSNLQYLITYVKGVGGPIVVEHYEGPSIYGLRWNVFRSHPVAIYSDKVVLGTSRDCMPDTISHAWRDDL